MTCNRCIFSVAEAPENFSLSDEMHNSVLLCSVHKCIMFLRPRHNYLNYFPDQVDRICSKNDACSVDRCILFYCTIVTGYGCIRFRSLPICVQIIYHFATAVKISIILLPNINNRNNQPGLDTSTHSTPRAAHSWCKDYTPGLKRF